MKKLFSLLLPVLAFAVACKKDKGAVNIEEDRLLRGKPQIRPGISTKQILTDATGRISVVYFTVNGKRSDGSTATITYSDNDFTITWPTKIKPSIFIAFSKASLFNYYFVLTNWRRCFRAPFHYCLNFKFRITTKVC